MGLYESILHDIKTIISIKDENIPKDFEKELWLGESKNYIRNLSESRREANLSEYFYKIFDLIFRNHQLSEQIIPQYKIGNVTIDYCISFRNYKIGFEVKPLISLSETGKIKLEELNWEKHKDQINSYLKGLEYVVLTNLNKFFLFSKQSIDDVQPFKKLNYDEFFENLKEENGDIVRVIKKLEREYPIQNLDEKFLISLKDYFGKLSSILSKELSFHLINQLIFLRVLEDVGAVDYGTSEIEFNEIARKFPNNYEKIFEEFFNRIKSFQYYYFDTELLGYNTYENLKREIEENGNNWELFSDAFNEITGFGGILAKFFKGLKFYDFHTIDEDIFGKAYETFLAEERKEHGIFYTPSFITNYLTKEVISNTFGKLAEDLINAINKDDFDTAEKKCDEMISFSVIDLACGSGAFLVKVFREIYKIYEDTYKGLDLYTKHSDISSLPEWLMNRLKKVQNIKKKLFTNLGIENVSFPSVVMLRHIYGIDVDEKAIEITKINLWKEMIKISPDRFNFRKIGDKRNIFPDLSRNIVCGNSLFGFNLDTSKYTENLRDLFKIVENYTIYPFDKNNREGLKNVINNIKEIYKEINESNSDIKNYNPVYYKVVFYDVFEKGGFSVVIGNPPYIRQERIKDLKPLLKKNYNDLFEGTADIYIYFFGQGYNILKEGGWLGFITSNKWMRAKYGENLRSFLKQKTTLKKIIDFGGYRVFEEATVDTSITIFEKRQTSDNKFYGVIVKEDFSEKQSLEGYIKSNQIEINQNSLSDKAFVLAEDKILKLKEKIEKIGKPLKDWDVKIYRGVLTGFNEAFIIDTKTRDVILANCKTEEERKRTKEIIKPVLRGRDIGRYCYEWKGLWMIIIPAGWTNQNRAKQQPENYFKTTFPAIYNHLISFKEYKAKGKGLFDRDDQGDYWWELRHCDYYPEFEKEKVVWQRVTQRFSFCYVPAGLYILDSMAFFTGDNIKYLLGLLNSKLIDWYVKTYVHQYADTGFLLSNQYVERIIVPPITPQNQHIVQQIENFVDQILERKKKGCNQDSLEVGNIIDQTSRNENNIDTSDLENQIDQLVYKLYDLTNGEIEIIERNK